MTPIIRSATASVLEAATASLRGPSVWPSSVTGFAHRICTQTGTAVPDFMLAPLRPTTAAMLRRTPELAAFGYVIATADQAMGALWLEAIEHLRGRDIYPADRQSFIFNPVEVLGVATGLSATFSVSDDHRQWFVTTVRRGFSSGQFRSTPLSAMAARAAAGIVDDAALTAIPPINLDLASLATQELVLAAGISLAFRQGASVSDDAFEATLFERVLRQPILINDAAEAVTLAVLSRRTIDRLTFQSEGLSPLEKVLGLCRRFPLFAASLQKRQRRRDPVAINDEYDVQDLLHAILRLHFDDVRPEEYTPSYAGNSSRLDFYLPRERMIIEAKMTRTNLGQKEVINELLIDVGRYASFKGVDTLVCLIYDPDRRCSNPKAVEEDIEKSGSRLKVKVVVCPQGL